MGQIDNVSENTQFVCGRLFRIVRTAWTHDDGLSFDVYDDPTGLLLTGESFDTEPAVADIESLLMRLGDDLRDGMLDSPVHSGIFDGRETALREIIAAVTTWLPSDGAEQAADSDDDPFGGPPPVEPLLRVRDPFTLIAGDRARSWAVTHADRAEQRAAVANAACAVRLLRRVVPTVERMVLHRYGDLPNEGCYRMQPCVLYGPCEEILWFNTSFVSCPGLPAPCDFEPATGNALFGLLTEAEHRAGPTHQPDLSTLFRPLCHIADRRVIDRRSLEVFQAGGFYTCTVDQVLRDAANLGAQRRGTRRLRRYR